MTYTVTKNASWVLLSELSANAVLSNAQKTERKSPLLHSKPPFKLFEKLGTDLVTAISIDGP